MSRVYLTFRMGRHSTILDPLQGDELLAEDCYYAYNTIIGAWQCDGTKVFGASNCGGCFKLHEWHTVNWRDFQKAMRYLCKVVDDYVCSRGEWSSEAAKTAVKSAIKVLKGMRKYLACYILRILLINATYKYGITCATITSSVMPFDATEHLSTAPQHCRRSLDLKNPDATQRVMLEEATKMKLWHARKALSKTKCFAFEYNILFCFSQQVIDYFYKFDYGNMKTLFLYLRTLTRSRCAAVTKELLLGKLTLAGASDKQQEVAKEYLSTINLRLYGIIEPWHAICHLMTKGEKKSKQTQHRWAMRNNKLYKLLKGEDKHLLEGICMKEQLQLRAKLMFQGGESYDIVYICLQLLELGLLYMTGRNAGEPRKWKGFVSKSGEPLKRKGKRKRR